MRYLQKTILYILIILILGLSYFVFAAPTVQQRPMTLDIGNQGPNITNVQINDNISGDDSMILTAENTTIIWCGADVFDLDGYPDIYNSWAVIWNSDMENDFVNYSSSDDNRWHYTNNSCNITPVTGTPNVNARLNCTFVVQFFANYSQWNCTITVNDTGSQAVNGTDNATMEHLLALDVVNNSIDWGERAVDQDYDADLNVSVENTGNVILDLQLDSYHNASAPSPQELNYSFNCSIGYIAVDQIVFNDTNGGVYAQSTKLSNSSYINVSDFDLHPQTGLVTTSPTNKSTYFGINIPSWPTINGTCTGWMRFEGMDGTP